MQSFLLSSNQREVISQKDIEKRGWGQNPSLSGIFSCRANAVVDWALPRWFHQLYSYSACAEVRRRNRILTGDRFHPHSHHGLISLEWKEWPGAKNAASPLIWSSWKPQPVGYLWRRCDHHQGVDTRHPELFREGRTSVFINGESFSYLCHLWKSSPFCWTLFQNRLVRNYTLWTLNVFFQVGLVGFFTVDRGHRFCTQLFRQGVQWLV